MQLKSSALGKLRNNNKFNKSCLRNLEALLPKQIIHSQVKFPALISTTLKRSI